MSATESDADFVQPSIDFSLSLSEGQATTSCECEAMFWDPYLQTPLGDVPQSVRGRSHLSDRMIWLL